jgi:hypothetical protein
MQILFRYTFCVHYAYYAHRCTEADVQGLPGQACGDAGVDSRISNEPIHEVAREWSAQGQALQQNCLTARAVYSDSTV